jgi:6,7-dimethyl-8-ribityllumazine synthase
MTSRVIEGSLVVPDGARFAVVASRFNHFIVDRLIDGALDALKRHGSNEANVTVVRVPGAWELPLVARRLAAAQDRLDAIIALGAVIRGSTPHFDYVAGEAAGGLAAAAHATRVPIIFGVLTTETDHRDDRASGRACRHQAGQQGLGRRRLGHRDGLARARAPRGGVLRRTRWALVTRAAKRLSKCSFKSRSRG